MRFLKLTAVAALATMFMAATALAGGAHCASKTKTASAGSSCSAKQAAACGTSAKGHCTIEATRLASGALVVHYTGKTDEAVSYLHAKADGAPDKFCCAMTSKMASNENCKVDIAKVSDGVLVFVTSAKQEVVDQFEKEFAALTTAAAEDK